MIGLVFTVPCRSAAGDFEWMGGASQNWLDAANWLENGAATTNIPGCNGLTTADVTIPGGFGGIIVACPGGGNVHLNTLDADSSLNIANTLTLDGPSSLTDPISTSFFNLVANSSVEIEGGSGLWDRGTISGTGSVTNNGQWTFGGIGSRLLRLNLFNDGTIHQQTGLTLQSDAGIEPIVTNVGNWRGDDRPDLLSGQLV